MTCTEVDGAVTDVGQQSTPGHECHRAVTDDDSRCTPFNDRVIGHDIIVAALVLLAFLGSAHNAQHFFLNKLHVVFVDAVVVHLDVVLTAKQVALVSDIDKVVDDGCMVLAHKQATTQNDPHVSKVVFLGGRGA